MVSFKFTIRLILLSFLFGISISKSIAQSNKFQFDKTLQESGDVITAFSIPYTLENLDFLHQEGIQLKAITRNWIYISATPLWISEKIASKKLSDFYFEYAPPSVLADSARYQHFVDPVHAGTNGLDGAYTGKGVIIGYVDQGIDFNHPDFITADGTKRVIRYWDHTVNSGGPASPYGYGIVWDSLSIANGTCTSSESTTAHGTTVAGQGSANGLANGTNKGVAPESSIIIVESNFNLPNWTLSIADACDYIFKVADTLGMPAVVNLSLGTYLGSHDGNDPASELMETMLDAKPGRIIVGAAGNSGAQGKYHVNEIVGADTSFVWIKNNPSGSAAFGANHIYFDLWTNETAATFQYAFGADAPGPNYSLRGTTDFRTALLGVGTAIYDTIYNSSNQRIATIEIYPELVGDNYNLQVYFSNVDSTAYLYRFMTKGSGSYDIWSGAWMGLNDFETNVPTTIQYPPIADYIMPDSLQTIVSSWACSQKVITVGNARNRQGHMDKNNNYYTPATYTPTGGLSPNSSKGPNRNNVIKPDITASGDVSLTAAPFWLLTNPAYNGTIDQGGWHARNGGTSMASPVVAGIAALYLESCPKATYLAFKTDLTTTAFTDAFTGPVPNNAYGYGKPHALNLMLGTMFTASIAGPTEKCADDVPLTINASVSNTTAYWSTGFVGSPLMVSTAGDYIADVYDLRGCLTTTDTHTVIQLIGPPILDIIQVGNVLATTSFDNYQWTLNGVDIPGATSSTLTITPPYGTYTCYSVSVDGCISETPPLTITAGIDIVELEDFVIYPNPTNDVFTISSHLSDCKVKVFDAFGKELDLTQTAPLSYSIAHLKKGIYHLLIETDYQKIQAKIIRM